MYIVTGGAGFIGSAFLAELNKRGIYEIIVVDELDETEKWKNLSNKHFLDYFHKEQFAEMLASKDNFQKVKAVIHFGACSSTTERDAEYMLQNNYRFSRLLAEWALNKGTRLIYASSAATYGDGECGFSDSDEVSLQLKPLNVYAFSKQLFDIWAIRTGAVSRMAGVKFFNVYGPNEYHKENMTSVVFKSHGQIKETGKVNLFKSYRPEYKDGEQKRDFVYVKDCCSVLYWLLENPKVCGIYNLGTGKARTWNDLVNAVFTALNKPPQINYIEMPETLRGKYQYLTEAKMDKLKAAGCDVPFHPLEEGVKDYVQNYLEQEYPYL